MIERHFASFPVLTIARAPQFRWRSPRSAHVRHLCRDPAATCSVRGRRGRRGRRRGRCGRPGGARRPSLLERRRLHRSRRGRVGVVRRDGRTKRRDGRAADEAERALELPASPIHRRAVERSRELRGGGGGDGSGGDGGSGGDVSREGRRDDRTMEGDGKESL